MSLKPKRVDFDAIWTDLHNTIKDVVTCGAVKNKVWNDRFSYPSISLLFRIYFHFKVIFRSSLYDELCVLELVRGGVVQRVFCRGVVSSLKENFIHLLGLS